MASERTDPEADRPGATGTPEGHTPEKPAADEYGKLGTPATGLSLDVPHAADAEDVREAGHEDEVGGEHTDEAEPLGPIDWRAWGASLLGIAVAALIGLALALPTLPR